MLPNGAAKTAGIDLGNYVAQQYITSHQNDGWNLPDAYTPTVGPGHWSTDPMVAPNIQKGWGSDWGSVNPWAMPNPDYFDSATPFTIADMNTQRYTDAFNEVKAYGSRVSAVRTATQTATGLFWAYDRPGTGAPPVLFIENMVDIGESDRQHAGRQRADVCHGVGVAGGRNHCGLGHQVRGRSLAAHHGHPRRGERRQPEHGRRSDWEYLGAPGNDPGSATDDFTPPFPAYVSGHATMGGAIFKSLGIVLRHE